MQPGADVRKPILARETTMPYYKHDMSFLICFFPTIAAG